MPLNLERRVSALEEQVRRLEKRRMAAPTSRDWVDDLYGKFAGDPIFARAMRLGRKYRKSSARKPKSGR